jgi:hypothetical protein
VWQWHQQEEASIPPRIIMKRSILSAALINIFLFGALQCSIYFLPIWFQIAKAAGPTKSGVMLLPTVLTTALLSIVSGGLGKCSSETTAAT